MPDMMLVGHAYVFSSGRVIRLPTAGIGVVNA